MSKKIEKPIIGKAAIESLSIAMYDAPFFIYREYVQNAADSIDHAVKQNVLQSHKNGQINIFINKEKRQIIFEDNGIGIQSKFVRAYLGNIAQSTKNRYQDKGFRGIGRLGGLGYCNKLIYETSAKGESVKSIVTWDAENLRYILDDPELKRDASEVVSIVTDFKRAQDDAESHYMRIVLEGVVNEALLDLFKVKSYLSMVAPLPFDSAFSYAKEIYKQARIENVFIDEYTVNVNEDQLFKSYKDDILKLYKTNTGEVLMKYDEVVDITFVKAHYKKDLLYWGWYGITKNMKYIPEENNEKYIRLRKSNIQIGLKSRLDEFHKKQTGSQYFIGEIYAVHRELHPNARRDFFIENPFLTAFIEKIEFLFQSLHELFYDFSKKNSALSTIAAASQSEEKLQNALKRGADDQRVKDLRNDYKRKNEKVLSAQESLLALYNKDKKGALAKVISEAVPILKLERDIKVAHQSAGRPIKATVEDKLDNEELRLLNFIIDVIKSTYAKKASQKLITRIRKEIENNFD